MCDSGGKKLKYLADLSPYKPHDTIGECVGPSRAHYVLMVLHINQSGLYLLNPISARNPDVNNSNVHSTVRKINYKLISLIHNTVFHSGD